MQIFRILITGTQGCSFAVICLCTPAACESLKLQCRLLGDYASPSSLPKSCNEQRQQTECGSLSLTKHSPSTIMVVRNLHRKLNRNIQQISHHRDMFTPLGNFKFPANKQDKQGEQCGPQLPKECAAANLTILETIAAHNNRSKIQLGIPTKDVQSIACSPL